MEPSNKLNKRNPLAGVLASGFYASRVVRQRKGKGSYTRKGRKAAFDV